MLLDVSDLLRRKVARKMINLSIPKDIIFQGNEEISCNKAVDFEGMLIMTGDLLSLEGRINTELILNCSRCIEKFIYPVDIEIHEEFSNDGEDRDDNVIFIDSDNINITEIVENNIIMVLPIKILCSESCRGLCQHCGTNLNNRECDCDKKDVDPRLAKLKDMFLND